MTQGEKNQLKQELLILYPDFDPNLLDTILQINQDLPLTQARIQTELMMIQRMLFQLEEKVKLGEIEIENSRKIQNLREKANELQKQIKANVGVFYLE